MTDTYSVPGTCPACGHNPITERVYGLIRSPSKTFRADERAGRKERAGCVFARDAIAYYCRACQWRCSCEEARHPLVVMMERWEEEEDTDGAR